MRLLPVARVPMANMAAVPCLDIDLCQGRPATACSL